MDGFFLAEVLGYRDPADGLFDGLVDVGHSAHTGASHHARQAAVANRQQCHHGYDGQHDQRQSPVDADQHNRQNGALDDLGDQVGDEGDQLAKVLRVAGDARGNFARGELIIEGEIMVGGRGEGVRGQFEHNAGDCLDDQSARDPVCHPHQHAEQERQATDDQRNAGVETGLHQVQPARGDDGQQRAGAGDHQRQ